MGFKYVITTTGTVVRSVIRATRRSADGGVTPAARAASWAAAASVVPNSDGWIEAARPDDVAEAVERMRKIVPGGGTAYPGNLYKQTRTCIGNIKDAIEKAGGRLTATSQLPGACHFPLHRAAIGRHEPAGGSPFRARARS